MAKKKKGGRITQSPRKHANCAMPRNGHWRKKHLQCFCGKFWSPVDEHGGRTRLNKDGTVWSKHG